MHICKYLYPAGRLVVTKFDCTPISYSLAAKHVCFCIMCETTSAGILWRTKFRAIILYKRSWEFFLFNPSGTFLINHLSWCWETSFSESFCYICEMWTFSVESSFLDKALFRFLKLSFSFHGFNFSPRDRTVKTSSNGSRSGICSWLNITCVIPCCRDLTKMLFQVFLPSYVLKFLRLFLQQMCNASITSFLVFNLLILSEQVVLYLPHSNLQKLPTSF